MKCDSKMMTLNSGKLLESFRNVETTNMLIVLSILYGNIL